MTFAATFDDARTAAATRNDFAPLIAQVPYARYLGLCAGPEPGTLQLPFAEKLIGSPVLPAIHGGVVAAFMELTAQLAVLLVLEQQRMPKAVDFSIDYLRSARTIDSFASAHVERLGTRVAQVQVRCWQAEPAKPVAVARAHFLLAGPLA